jgi:hypothetical protein
VNHINDFRRTVNEYDLQIPPVGVLTLDEVLALTDRTRKRASRMANNVFGISRIDPVLGNVIDIAGVPPKRFIHIL